MSSEFVETNSGPVIGKKCISCKGEHYLSFQGIPFAKPPIGPLRFKVYVSFKYNMYYFPNCML